MTRIEFPGLSPRAYEHPADRAALAALRKLPGFDLLVRKMFGSIGDRSLRLAFLASSVRVSEKQFPEVHESFLEACRVLDVEPVPELFVAQTPIVNAGAVGVDKPFIVINSGTVALMSPEELQFILGHELGHVLSGHVLYKTMIRLLLKMTTLALALPLGGAALYAITTALLEWDRKSELSSDRAGLLVVQDPELAMRVNMKLAGGGQTEQMDVEEFIRQSDEYRNSGTVIDGMVKLLNLIGRTHPFPVLRLAELNKWVESGDYQKVLDGDYPRRAEDAKASVYKEIKSSSQAYKEDFERTADPLFGFFKNVGSGVGRGVRTATDSLFGRFKAEPEGQESGGFGEEAADSAGDDRIS
ncbi:MAG: M48 family metallopeptidase [Myxococcota bacterium]|nr:M48 family metallopeptidase [Myxococcota bacterium]